MTRDEIIARLAEKFGPHKAYDHSRRGYVPDGNDEDANTLIAFPADDGCNSIRTLTYGEIADALCDPS